MLCAALEKLRFAAFRALQSSRQGAPQASGPYATDGSGPHRRAPHEDEANSLA